MESELQSELFMPREVGIAPRTVHPTTPIHPPNLTDTSFRGLYAATSRVPSTALRGINRVSAIIGAPALAGGAAPTVHVAPPTGLTPPARLFEKVTVPVAKLYTRGQTFAKGIIASIRK